MAQMKNETAETSSGKGVFLRILSYARPYIKSMLVCFALVLAVTALNLYRPILIGRAIDGYIEGYARPLACVSPEDADVEFDGLYLSRDENAESDSYAILVYYSENYYFVRDLTAQQAEELSALTGEELSGATENGAAITFPSADGKSEYTGRLLDRDELSVLRKGDHDGIIRIGIIIKETCIKSHINDCALARFFALDGKGISVPARYIDRVNPFHILIEFGVEKCITHGLQNDVHLVSINAVVNEDLLRPLDVLLIHGGLV